MKRQDIQARDAPKSSREIKYSGMTRSTPAKSRGELRGPLPVAGTVAADQPMSRHDRHRVNRVVDRMDEAFGKRSLVDCPGLGDIAKPVGIEDLGAYRQPAEQEPGGEHQQSDSLRMPAGRQFRPSFRRAMPVRISHHDTGIMTMACAGRRAGFRLNPRLGTLPVLIGASCLGL